MIRALRRSAVALGVLLTACEHPISVVSPHAEVGDLVLRDSTGTLVARTVVSHRWDRDSLVLHDGMPLRLTIEALDFRGVPVRIEGRAGYSVRFEAERGALVQWEPLTGHGVLRPFAAGVTDARFLVWHGSHADFVSPWLRVVILPPVPPTFPVTQ